MSEVNDFLDDRQQSILLEMREFVSEHVLSQAGDWDLTQSMSGEVISEISNKGWLGGLAPASYGGMDMDPYLWGAFCEEIGRSSCSLLGLPTVHGMVIQAISRWGTDEQKTKYLPELALGKRLGAFALTEPEVGSDAANVQAQAVKSGNAIKINGRKRWITYGNLADVYIVIARFNDKPTAFLVESQTPGLKKTKVRNMLGFRAAELADLEFIDCEIPEENMIGKPGFGFSHIAGTALDHGRFCIAWGCVGLADGCLQASMKHSLERKQFGKPINEHQLIQEMLTDMLVGVRAGRGLCMQSAKLKRNNDPKVIMETSIAKYFTSRQAANSSRDAVQILGGTGCSGEANVERFFRDAKVMEIIEGSSQIQQMIISKHAVMQFRQKQFKEDKT